MNRLAGARGGGGSSEPFYWERIDATFCPGSAANQALHFERSWSRDILCDSPIRHSKVNKERFLYFVIFISIVCTVNVCWYIWMLK